MKRTNPEQTPAFHRAGWPVRDWCASAGISGALLYKLDDARRPASVKVGRRRLITEAPQQWLARMAAASSSSVT